uniref:adenylate kinase n=1 Tax=Kalanchoe fedtschenkoi TaxID=63787 RepID=A0A7N0V7P3_KALFE
MPAIGRLAAAARPVTRFRGACHCASRSHGASAVQAMCDLKDVWLDEDAQRRGEESEPVMDSEGSVSGKGVQWVVIGDPGTKKHVYASRLSKLIRVPHISIGSLVRQELSPRSELYQQISNALYQGQAVPEDVVFGLLSQRLRDEQCRGESGFILDGIPRSRRQAEILDEIADIDLVIRFKFTEKLLGNSLISSTSRGHAWNEKLGHYSVQVKELEDYYKRQKKLLSFQVASGAPAETWQGLVAALWLKHMNAAHSSPELTI